MNRTMLSKYLGLAMKAGAVLFGEDIIMEKLRYAKVVLIDANASDKYKERLLKKTEKIPTFQCDLKSELQKDNVKAVAIINDGLAKAIINLMR